MSWILMKGERSLDCDQGPGDLAGVGLFIHVTPSRAWMSPLKAALVHKS